MLADLPDPDRVFVGGGGLGVLDAALGRLRPGGVVVATYAAIDRAAAAGTRLGHLVAGLDQPGCADRGRWRHPAASGKPGLCLLGASGVTKP